MSNTVSNHQISSAYDTPKLGDQLDPSVLVAHLNSTRAAYNAHDNDPGIHLQSDTVLPSVGTAGQKFLLVDTTTVSGKTLITTHYDTGSVWASDTTFDSTAKVKNGQPGIYNAGNSGTSKTIDWANSPIQKVTLTGNCTFNFSNAIIGGTYTLILVQSSGGNTVTLGSPTPIWDFGDNPPSYNTGAGKKNVISGLWDGAEYLAAFAVKGA